MLLIFALIITLIAISLILLNKKYVLLAGCKRLKTIDGSPLSSKIFTIPGKTIFGNNLDVLAATPEKAFQYLRKNTRQSKGKSYLLNFALSPTLCITTAEDAEEIFQSQALITKSIIYDLLVPFLGLGLLISTGEQWQFRRKILTPAFHFNILQTFVEVFKEETCKFTNNLKQKAEQILSLTDIIPHYTLNNVCETALGVKLDDIPGSEIYRKSVNELEALLINRLCNPIMYIDQIYRCTKEYKEQEKLVKIIHSFSSKVIQKRREELKQTKVNNVIIEKIDEFGKKQRYALLDTLLDAETQDLIDHQGICDEVNTFMFEGYDTTFVCLIFTLLNLALHQDIQQKCFEEVQNLADIKELTLFDLNNLEYLECVIKETLRLYPSVPFFARQVVKETVVNGLVLPVNTQIHIHTFDIMRDERHFPEPLKFEPTRFLSTNNINRHPFAFVPFSAGPRNCIGQKFAMLEMKALLVSLLKEFQFLPITRIEDVTFENGLVLRAKEKIEVKIILRKQ